MARGYTTNDPVFIKIGIAGPPKKDLDTYDTTYGMGGSDVFDITNSLRSFKFVTATSEEGQTQGSLKYTIELINITERFEKVLRDYYSYFYPNMQPGELVRFPILVIQWGYGPEVEDGTSKIHLGVIDQIDFKFTAAKEKVLTIGCVDLMSHYGMYGKSTFSTDIVVEETQVGPDEKGDRPLRPISEIISEAVSKMCAKYPLSSPHVDLGENFAVTIKSLRERRYEEVTKILAYKREKGTLEKTARSALPGALSSAAGAVEGIVKHFQRTPLYKELSGAEKLEKERYIYNEIFKYFGYSEIQHGQNEGQWYTITYTTYVNGAAGETKTTWVSENQLGPGKLDSAQRIAETDSSFRENTPNDTEITLPSPWVQQRWGQIPPGTYTVDSTLSQIQTQNMSSETPLYQRGDHAYQIELRDSNGVAVGTRVKIAKNRPNSTGDPFGTPNPLYQEIKDTNMNQMKGFEDANRKNQNLLIKEAGIEKDATDIRMEEADHVVGAQLADLRKLKEQRPKWIRVSCTDGTTLSQWIDNQVTLINGLIPDPGDHIGIFKQPFTQTRDFKRGSESIQNVVDTLTKEPDKPIYGINIVPFKAADKLWDDSPESEEMQIFSIPGLHYDPKDMSTIELKYGDPSHPVLELDFHGDVGVFTRGLAGFATYQTMNENMAYLTHDLIKKRVGYVISQIVAPNKALMAGASDEVKKELKAWDPLRKSPIVLSAESIEWLKGLADQIAQAQLHADLVHLRKQETVKTTMPHLSWSPTDTTIAGPDESGETGGQKVVETFVKFITFISRESAWRALFSIDESGEGRVPASYSKLFESLESEPQGDDTESVGYRLTDSNIFDNYIALGGGGDDRISLNYLLSRNFMYQYPASIKLKTLGIPEMDTLRELMSRSVALYVRDISRERFSTGPPQILHWLTGPYRVLGIAHTIDRNKGYRTELELIKNPFGYTPVPTPAEEAEAV